MITKEDQAKVVFSDEEIKKEMKRKEKGRNRTIMTIVAFLYVLLSGILPIYFEVNPVYLPLITSTQAMFFILVGAYFGLNTYERTKDK